MFLPNYRFSFKEYAITATNVTWLDQRHRRISSFRRENNCSKVARTKYLNDSSFLPFPANLKNDPRNVLRANINRAFMRVLRNYRSFKTKT